MVRVGILIGRSELDGKSGMAIQSGKTGSAGVMAWTRKKEPVEAWSWGESLSERYGGQLFAGSSPVASILSGV